ncbi:MAG TPA: hypothetical protein VK574_15640 [Terracidiphilus sp.]|nr:hypothetical protein [Terracidiphilus sp.]
MHTSGNHDGRVYTGRTGSISIHINDSERVIHPVSGLGGGPNGETMTIPPDLIHLFEYVERAPATLPERFPRLTFLAIALALLVTALTAEYDYLRSAGYFWR